MTTEPTDPGAGFLSRWSRRKQAERARPADAPPTPPATPAPDLPPIEALGATSDYRAFLQQGVTAALQASALHKAWTSDAAIAGFRGMADYDWDFNATGYGRLRIADDVPKLLAAVLRSPEAPPAEPVEPAAPNPSAVRQTIPAPATAPKPGLEPKPEQQPEDTEHLAEAAPPRRHGSALPA